MAVGYHQGFVQLTVEQGDRLSPIKEDMFYQGVVMTALRKGSAGYGARELQSKPDKVTFEENCLCMDILGVAFQTEGIAKAKVLGQEHA